MHTSNCFRFYIYYLKKMAEKQQQQQQQQYKPSALSCFEKYTNFQFINET